MILFNEKAEQNLNELGFTIIKRGNTRGAYFEGCYWWSLVYEHLELSVYYDPKNILGIVGAPYYELYDGNETYRYLASEEPLEFIIDIKIITDEYKIEYQEYPERFL